MIYTIICILCTTLLGALFKWSEHFKLRSAAIIPVNYFICFIIGFLHTGKSLFLELSTAWILYSIGLGGLFIIGFSYFARAIAKTGLPMATLFQKMSIILTVIVAVLIGDTINLYQIIGLIIGIVSFYFILGIDSVKSFKQFEYFGLLIGTLISSSVIEIIFIYVNKTFAFSSDLKLIFPSYIFFVAGILGLLSLRNMNSSYSITKSEIVFGILLGIPNFYSIYFLMMALNHEMSGSAFFPVLNCSVIMLSAIMGKYLFKESLRIRQQLGVALSMISIFLIFYFKK